MNILVVGGGGREHAIIAALKKSSRTDKLWCAPGNAGISALAECFDVKATDIDRILALAKKLKPDYVFVAPDDPLVLGMVDALNEAGFKTFGPRKNAAILEGSKVFSKGLMKKYNIPTAAYETFTDADKAIGYVKAQNSYPTGYKMRRPCARKRRHHRGKRAGSGTGNQVYASRRKIRQIGQCKWLLRNSSAAWK